MPLRITIAAPVAHRSGAQAHLFRKLGQSSFAWTAAAAPATP